MPTNTIDLIDEHLMQQLEKKFQYKREIARHREQALFGVFEQALTDEERILLKYLYAYMPLHDMADYDGEFFLAHVRRALEIREMSPWGRKIPDHIFLNFVLPYRVNNENIDNSREVIFNELYDRVKDLPMKAAIMEANYWCHERATYVGTDRRTVSPTTLMRTALGRCGEQSTLAVAALRSVGIPARQCYTPRWAHCDSNHAWVEAWADGTWYFLGACEPEGRLNEGWFRAPSRRAMLVNTRVFADYNGPEETCSNDPWYTEINLLDNYAPTKTIMIKVVDEQGKPAQADVHFQMYNYAEYYSISILPTNEQGEVTFTTGYGDLLIHVKNEQGHYGFRKIYAGDADQFEVTLYEKPEYAETIDWLMTAPREIPDSSDDLMSDAERDANDAHVQRGTAIRSAFEATFMNQEQSDALAQDLGLSSDRVWSLLKLARGNSREIASFLREQTPTHGEWALKLLESLRPKDLQDTMKPSLIDHLEGTAAFREQVSEDLYMPYVCCPRVLFEMIVPYRSFFQSQFSEEERAIYVKDPQVLVEHFTREITVDNEMDRYSGMATPVGVYQLKRADRESHNICFVAAARSLGIPARLEPLDARPQFWHAGSWQDAIFETGHDADLSDTNVSNGYVQFSRSEEDHEQEAAYQLNFTLARLDNGIYKTLTFPFGEKDVYDKPFEVQSGDYRLTTGTRLSSGSVLVRFAFFTVPEGKVAYVPITFLMEEIEIPVLGQVDDAQWNALAKATDEMLSDEVTVLAWLDPEREPSKHLARELRELREGLEEWGGRIILLAEEQRNRGTFNMEGLPAHTTYSEDTGSACLEAFRSVLGDWNGQEYPLVLIIDGQRQIRYQFQGYKLGIGSDIMKTVTRI